MSRQYLLSIFIAAIMALWPSTGLPQTYGKDVDVSPCFTPGSSCTDRIISVISSARSEILVQAYSFTSAPIAKALIDAHKRGVKVSAILDKSQRTAKYSSATFLANMKVPTYIDDRHAIAHNKIIIVDRITTITGSFNFTRAAQEKNAENLLIIRSAKIAEAYRKNWQDHLAHSEKLDPRY